MTPTVLFRSDKWSTDEMEIARQFFPTYPTRMSLPANSLVIGRYSVLPFYRELCEDLKLVGSKLINSSLQHSFIANFDWYHALQHDSPGITPNTYFDATLASQRFNDMPHGMILKGRTNSAKNWYWMYAKTKDDFYRIDEFLHQHEMIAAQGVVYREYVPLKVIEKCALPKSFDFVNEWRCFFYKKNLLTYGYYWSMATDEAIDRANNQNLAEMLMTAQKAANTLAYSTNFFVVDVAQTVDGKWIVIEVNDGQMSGLSLCNPELLYKNLSFFLAAEQTLDKNKELYEKFAK